MSETQKRRGPAPTAPCGTRSAYNRHIRYGEDPCAACRDVYNAYQIEQRRKRNALKPPTLTYRPDRPAWDRIQAIAERTGMTVDDTVAALLAAGLSALDTPETVR